MKEILIAPQIDSFETFKEFADTFELSEKDLILTNEYIYNPLMKEAGIACKTIFQEKYGAGEPSDIMVDAILAEMNKFDCERIIAVGGGTIIDIAKIMCLEGATDTDALYDRKELVKAKKLIIIPTTCGTGSEVTNIAVVNRTRKGTKMGLTSPNMYADHAVLIPEFLKTLPYYVFATSSIDALIHAVESYLGPFSTSYTEMFAVEAIKEILGGYCRIALNGQDARFADAHTYLKASNYAGIAFGNNGCGAVHAMSYALGGKYHVPHGESNYEFFTDVLKTYYKKQPVGKMQDIMDLITETCKANGFTAEGNGIEILEALLAKVLTKKAMHEFGAVQEDIRPFAESTIANQQRLLRNNYVELTVDEVEAIYQARL